MLGIYLVIFGGGLLFFGFYCMNVLKYDSKDVPYSGCLGIGGFVIGAALVIFGVCWGFENSIAEGIAAIVIPIIVVVASVIYIKKKNH